MSVSLTRDIGHFIQIVQGWGQSGLAASQNSSQYLSLGGTSTANADPMFGVPIDRLALGRRYLSAKPFVLVQGTSSWDAVGSNPSAKITVSLKLQDGATTSAFADYSTAQAPADLTIGTTTTSTAAANITPLVGAHQGIYDLSGARRYIRMGLTITISATSSPNNNTLVFFPGLALGGPEALPAV